MKSAKQVYRDIVNSANLALNGGPRSGNWGHAGRPGMRGGSAPRGGGLASGDWSRERLEKALAKTKVKVNVTDSVKKAAEKKVNAMQADNKLFTDKFKTISSNLGAEGHMGPIKKADRVAEKASLDYHGDVNDVKDIVRSTLIISNPADINKYTSEIGKHFDIDRVKNSMDADYVGYKDAKINPKFKDGHVGEVIVITPEYLKAKEQPTVSVGTGHEWYEISRSPSVTDGERAVAVRQTAKIYAEAERRLQSRLDKK